MKREINKGRGRKNEMKFGTSVKVRYNISKLRNVSLLYIQA
jgi:hypothetical protein